MTALGTELELDELAALAQRGGRIALDTEFMSESRYHAMLCLTAIAVDDPSVEGGIRTALIDPLAGDAPDPAPLAALLADPQVEVVVHAGRQDLAILRRAWGVDPTTVFDTQIAAGFVGLGAGSGYGKLVQQVLKITLDKGETFTRWDQRPLTEDQIRYAHEDVANLLALATELQRRLEAAGRLAWAVEECAPLAASTDRRDPQDAWRRLPRSNQLKPRQLATAQALAAWREQTAADEDRTVSSVVGDAQLVEIARRQPTDERALREIRGLYPRTIQRRGEEILAVVRDAADAEPPRVERRRPGSDVRVAPLVALAEAFIRARADEVDLAYELIASRSDLVPIVIAVRAGEPEPDVRTLRGWRRELVGEDLLALLTGRNSLGIDEHGRIELR